MLRQQSAHDPALLHDLDSKAGVTRIDQKPPGADFGFVINRIAPPAQEIANRVLHAADLGTGGFGSIMDDLMKSWEDMHYLRGPDDAGPILPLPADKKPLASRSLCFRVGYCMCGEAMAPRRRFRQVLASQLKYLFAPRSRPRQLYDSAHSVLRVCHPGPELSHASYWLIGYGNLNTNDFTIKPLHATLGRGSGLLCFEARLGEHPVDIEAVGAKLDLGQSWVVEILTLAVDSPAIVFKPYEFKPLAFVEPLAPPTRAQVWPILVKVKNPLRARAVARQALAGPPPVEDELYELEDVADDVVESEVLEEILALADADIEEAGGWQLSSEEEENGEEVQGNVVGYGRSGLSTHIFSSVIDGRRPPSLGGSSLYRGPRQPGPVLPPPPAPDEGRRAIVGRKDFLSLWPKFLHAENAQSQPSYLRLSETWGKAHSDMLAMCYWHGGRCQRSRSCLQERPVGELWAWLHYGMRADCVSKEDHIAYHPPFAERAAARSEFEAFADNEQWLAAECGGVGQGEPERNRHSDE